MKRLFSRYLSWPPVFRIWVAVLWSVLLFTLCLLPVKGIPHWNPVPYMDKWVHLFLFLVFFLVWSLSSTKSYLYILYIFIISILTGIGIEILQEYLHMGRHFDWYDIVFDGMGSSLGYFILKLFKPDLIR